MSARPPGERARRPLCLVGLRCAGKTTVGRGLAARLALPFFDLDDELARAWAAAEGEPARPAGELLRLLGEPEFRRLEAEALERLVGGEPAVVATGAGCVETAVARAALGRAHVVWLDAPDAELARRMRRDSTSRPALTPGGDPVAEIPELRRRREPRYRALAALRVDGSGDDPSEVVARVLDGLENPAQGLD